MGKGFLLVETLIVLFLVCLFTTLSVPLFNLVPKIELTANAQIALLNLIESQYYSLVTDADVNVEINQDKGLLMISGSHNYNNYLIFPNYVNLRINRLNGLGFKSSFTTKYAGTLFMESIYLTKKISFPVGVSLLSVK